MKKTKKTKKTSRRIRVSSTLKRLQKSGEKAIHVCRLKGADLFCIWNEPEDWTWYKEMDELQNCGDHHWTIDRQMYDRFSK